MKTRIWTILFGIALVLAGGALVVPSAYARGPGNGGQGQGVCTGDTYIDNDGDGVCDNAGTGIGNGGQGQGVCTGDTYIDNDGDGVCDNAGTGRGNGGQGRGAGQGQGAGQGFVDNDGDGVCDTRTP